MFTRKVQPIRIIGHPDNQGFDKWSLLYFPKTADVNNTLKEIRLRDVISCDISDVILVSTFSPQMKCYISSYVHGQCILHCTNESRTRKPL